MNNSRIALIFLIIILLLNSIFAYDSSHFSTDFEFSDFNTASALKKADLASEMIADTLGVSTIKFYLTQSTFVKNYTFGSNQLSYDYSQMESESDLFDVVLPMLAEEYMYQLDDKYGEFHKTWLGQGLSETLKNVILKKQGINVKEWEDFQKDVLLECSTQVKRDLSHWSYGYTCYGDNCFNYELIDPYGGYCYSYPNAKRNTILYYASSQLVSQLFDSDLTKIKAFFTSASQCNSELGWGHDEDYNTLYDSPNKNIRYHTFKANPKNSNIDKTLASAGLNYTKFEDYNKQIHSFELAILDKNIPSDLFINEKNIAPLNQLLCKGNYEDINKEITKRLDAINKNLPILLNAKIDINNLKNEVSLLSDSKCKTNLQTEINSISLNSINVGTLETKLSTLKNDINQCRFMPKEIVTPANTQTESNPPQNTTQQNAEGNTGTSEGDNFLISLVIAIILMAVVIYGTHKYDESFNAPAVHTTGHHLHRKHGANSFNYNNWALVIGGVIVSFIPILGLFGLVFNCFLLYHLGKMDAHNKGVIWKAIVLIFFTGIILGLIVFFGSKYLENQRPKRY